MSLSQVLGQPKAIAALRAALSKGQVHHAYLFSGPEGVGKELAAVGLVQALFCPERPPLGCGECAVCRRVASRSHPDVTWVMPEDERVARKLAGRADFAHTPSRDIKVEQIRALQERLALRALEGRWRVALLVCAEQLNVQAQNALLKTLEEPPPDTVLVLIAQAADKLLPTLRSRCARVAFGPLPTPMVQQKLAEARQVDEATAQLVAVLAGGSLARALAFDVEALEKRKEVVADFEAALGADARGALHFAEVHGASRADAERALRILQTWVRDLSVAQAGGTQLANADLLDLARKVASSHPAAVLDARAQLLDQTLTAIAIRNGQPRLHLERMLLELGAGA